MCEDFIRKIDSYSLKNKKNNGITAMTIKLKSGTKKALQLKFEVIILLTKTLPSNLSDSYLHTHILPSTPNPWAIRPTPPPRYPKDVIESRIKTRVFLIKILAKRQDRTQTKQL